MRFAVLALVGCSALSPVPSKTATDTPSVVHGIFGVPGEKMEFRVRLRGIVVGNVRVAIGEPGVVERKQSIIVRSRGETSGVLSLIGKLAWELQSTLDLDRGLPIVNHEEFWAELVAGEKEHDKKKAHWSEHDSHHDAHSAVGRFRGWRSKLGDRMQLEVRIAEARLDVAAHHAGRDYIAGAKAHAIRYEGVIAGRFKFAAWVSDDPSHVPLRFQTTSKWGAIEVDLVEYRLPN
jgi:hypothetical protein